MFKCDHYIKMDIMKTKAMIVDVAISGGGPAGLTLAALLARGGLKTAVIDPAPAPTAATQKDFVSGRTAALLNASLNVLRAAGLGDALEADGTPLKIMRIVDDGRTDIAPLETVFEAKDAGQPYFGLNIPNAGLRTRLAKGLAQQENIVPFFGEKLQTYQAKNDHVALTLANGREINAALLIGADGRESLTRTIAGIDAHRHDYGQTAMTFLVSHTKPHNFTSTEFHRAGGPFTFVPMAGNTSSVVWVEKTEEAQRILRLKKQDFQQLLQDRSRGFLGVVTVESAPESWPLSFLKAERLTAPRLALVAEAAHVLSPIGAQGLNLSLRDVAALAETIIDAARLGEDIGGPLVLARYEKRRRLDIQTRTLGIDTLNRAVADERPLVGRLRRLGLKGMQSVPPLKSLAMHQGLAPTVDDGRLVRGLPL